MNIESLTPGYRDEYQLTVPLSDLPYSAQYANGVGAS